METKPVHVEHLRRGDRGRDFEVLEHARCEPDPVFALPTVSVLLRQADGVVTRRRFPAGAIVSLTHLDLTGHL